MPRPSDNFQLLAHQFDLVVEKVNQSKDPKERMHLPRHMKVILNEIDMLISSNLKRDSQDATSSAPPDQSTAES
jgi:hypothetical protein